MKGVLLVSTEGVIYVSDLVFARFLPRRLPGMYY